MGANFNPRNLPLKNSLPFPYTPLRWAGGILCVFLLPKRPSNGGRQSPLRSRMGLEPITGESWPDAVVVLVAGLKSKLRSW